MKKISSFFQTTSILLCFAGLLGAAGTFWLSFLNLKDGEASKTMSVMILIFGFIWAVAAVIAGISAFKQAKNILALQRTVLQSKLDPRYSKTAKKAYRARIDFKQCRVRSILIVLFCLVQMIFACTIGVKIGFIVFFGVCGIVVPLLFLAAAKSNS